MIRINVGSRDARIRVIVGIAVISLAFWGPRSYWAWLGLVPLLTGLFRYCPLYRAGRISTLEKVLPKI